MKLPNLGSSRLLRMYLLFLLDAHLLFLTNASGKVKLSHLILLLVGPKSASSTGLAPNGTFATTESPL